ncbi:minor capsid protein [Carnobacterium maltaromaticum]
MAKNDYWRKRESDNLKTMVTNESELKARLEKQYKEALKEINNEINKFYQNYSDKEKITISDALKRVKQHDVKEFSSKAKQYVKDKDFSPNANKELRLYNLTMKVNRLELLKAQINIELITMSDASEKEITKYLNSVAWNEFERQSGILGDTLHYNEKNIQKLINASFWNGTFSERIWQNIDDLRSSVNNFVRRSILQGKNPKTMASELMKKFDVSRQNAEKILLTETARIQAEVQKDCFKQAGYKKYEYIAETSACKVCQALDGTVHEIDKAQYGVNLYPMHPYCRCSTVPYYEKVSPD